MSSHGYLSCLLCALTDCGIVVPRPTRHSYLNRVLRGWGKAVLHDHHVLGVGGTHARNNGIYQL